MLVVAQGTTVDDYYSADSGADTIPESYVRKLSQSSLGHKIHTITPMLSSRVIVNGHPVLLTGVLPTDELRRSSDWQAANQFTEGLHGKSHEEGTSPSSPRENREVQSESTEQGTDFLGESGGDDTTATRQPRRNNIDSLGRFEAWAGSEAASTLGLQVGDVISVRGHELRVVEVRPPTGTIDDSRLFAHLHTVQGILGTGGVVSAIELQGCGCHLDLVRLAADIESLLPGTRVHTVRAIAETQWNTVSLLRKAASALVAILAALGGLSLGSALAANVRRRRRELACLAAIGAGPGTVLLMVLWKTVLVGAVGGALGGLVGSLGTFAIATRWIHAVVWPQPLLIARTLIGAVLVCVASGLIPATQAMRTDPGMAFRED